jgi:hypothetical protein
MMPFEFSAPERSVLGAVAALVIVIGLLWARRRRGIVASALSLLLRGVAAGTVILFLLDPSAAVEERDPGCVLAAFDHSRSVHPDARLAAFNQVRAAVSESGARLIAMGFGEGAKPLPADPAAAERLLTSADYLVSDPRPALNRLLLLPEAAGSAARILLATDGALPEPPADLPPIPALRPLVLPLFPAAAPELRASSLAPVTPPVLDEPVQLVLRGSAAKAAQAGLVVWEDGREVHRVRVNLKAGEFELPITLPAPAAGTISARRGWSLPATIRWTTPRPAW